MGLFSQKRFHRQDISEISLELSHFSIFFKGKRIFTKDFFETSLSGWTWLHGENGSGKSTFIRAMLGLCPQTEGKISIMGAAPQKIRSLIGYMPQKREENGLFLPALSHIEAAIPSDGFFSFARRKKKAQKLLRECGAEHLADRPLMFLSGGERQKVALAQAIAADPVLLILDEPFIALDCKGKREMAALLMSLEKKRHMAIFLATHEGGGLLPQKRRDLFLRKGSLFRAD